MAVDQHGQTYHGLVNPRKDLMERIGINHAEKMYRDTTSGGVRHVGYIIGGLWCEVYTVSQWKAEEE